MSLGEGATSEGEFWEALNIVVHEAAAGSVSDRGQRLRDLGPGRSPDAGRRHFAAGELVPGARTWTRSTAPTSSPASGPCGRRRRTSARGRGPALVHAHVHPAVLAFAVRRRAAVQDAGRARSRSAPRSASAVRGVPAGRSLSATGADLAAIGLELDREIDEAVRHALEAPQPAEEDATHFVYSPDVDPTSDAFSTAARAGGRIRRRWSTLSTARSRTRWRAIRASCVFGEDVADASRRKRCALVKGKGGVFKVTHGLQRLYGERPRLQHADRRSQHRRPGASAWPCAG